MHIACYYNILLTYSYRFVFTAFSDPLPFLGESPTENTFFNEEILGRSAGI
jgi:hypothetical protein